MDGDSCVSRAPDAPVAVADHSPISPSSSRLGRIVSRVDPLAARGVAPESSQLHLVLTVLASPVVLIGALVIAAFGPLSGALAAVALGVAFVCTALGRAPRLVAGALVAAGVLVLWSEAQPSAGRIGLGAALLVLVSGSLAIWTFGLLSPPRRRGARWIGLVAGCVTMAVLSPTLAFEAKVWAFSPTMEEEAQRVIAMASATGEVGHSACVGEAAAPNRWSGLPPWSGSVGPFSYRCAHVVGADDRKEVIFTSLPATVYAYHQGGTEVSGLVYAPAGPPVNPPVASVEKPYCFGHIAGDWYQFVAGTQWSEKGRCPNGEALTDSP